MTVSENGLFIKLLNNNKHKAGQKEQSSINFYKDNKFDVEIFHYDLYRIRTSSELDQLNIEENINNSITLIEWPEIIFEKNFN